MGPAPLRLYYFYALLGPDAKLKSEWWRKTNKKNSNNRNNKRWPRANHDTKWRATLSERSEMTTRMNLATFLDCAMCACLLLSPPCRPSRQSDPDAEERYHGHDVVKLSLFHQGPARFSLPTNTFGLRTQIKEPLKFWGSKNRKRDHQE